MHRTKLSVVALAALICACDCGNPAGNDGGPGGGAGGGGGQGAFAITVLDADAGSPMALAMAVDPAQERVGVVYFAPRGTQTMTGVPDVDIRYVEWRQGAVSAVETLRYVQRTFGLSLAFEPGSGDPVASYLGGAAGFEPGMSIFWFQSDAVLNRRTAGTWTESIVAADGTTIGATGPGAWQDCSNAVSSSGFLVGLWPSLVYSPSGTSYLAWRNCHNGSNSMQDWAGSDVNLAEGTGNPLVCVSQGGNGKPGYGARLQLAMGAGAQPGLVYDKAPDGPATNGRDVVFQQRNPDGTWTAPNVVFAVSNTQSGASLAYDATEGWGVAAVERNGDTLHYLRSADGVSWSAPDDVFGSGTGGWFPSLAMDPVNHEPAIAFYVCSARTGKNEGECPAAEDRLVVSQRISGNWREVVVDADGAASPKLGFFTSGKRVVAYRDPSSGAVKLAVER